MPISTYFTGSIEQRMSDDLHLAGVAERTRKGYLRAVRQLAEHAKCSQDNAEVEGLGDRHKVCDVKLGKTTFDLWGSPGSSPRFVGVPKQLLVNNLQKQNVHNSS